MADIFDMERRREIMSSIRSKNTKPELLVFRYLTKSGVYHQRHYKTKHGFVVDLALPRKKKAVFIDGDFWHGRTIERVIARRGNDDFWTKKLLMNIERDLRQRKLLEENGWSIYAAWESDLIRKRTQSIELENIKRFLTSQVSDVPRSRR
jgi:DNA mismatch endonuclease (patch repair protein)